MLFYTLGQSAAFLLMLPSGLLIGLLWDALRLMRRLLEPGLVLSLCLDLAFALTAAALFALGLIDALYGEIRLYALMGALCGFYLYGTTLSPLLHCFLSTVLKAFTKLWHGCLRFKAVRRLLR